MDEQQMKNYIILLENELRKTKTVKPAIRQLIEIERLKCASGLVLIGFIIGYLILPSPIALLFPKPIQQSLRTVHCTTNAVYNRLGI